MYPLVALKIKDHVPSVVYYPQEGVERKMTLTDENVRDIILDIAGKLDLYKDSENTDRNEAFQDLLSLARESHEDYSTDLPDVNPEDIEFDLKNKLNKSLDKILGEKEELYPDVEMSNEVRNELVKNQNSDILASILDILYYTLIAKTLVAASDLGIGTIQLDDEHKNARLLEKMSKELEKIGVDFVIP